LPASLALSYQAHCSLDYELHLVRESSLTEDGQARTLAERTDDQARLALAPEGDSLRAVFSRVRHLGSQDRPSHVEVEENSFLLSPAREHLHETAPQSQGSAPPTPAPSALGWEELGLFFPALSPSGGLLWSPAVPQALGSFGDRATQEDTERATAWIDSVYSLDGEPLALLFSTWKETHTTADIRPDAPLVRRSVLGSSVTLWAVNRGWPVFSDVFVSVEEERVSRQQSTQKARWVFGGQAFLRDSCGGFRLP
jgi:hypothetical protein